MPLARERGASTVMPVDAWDRRLRGGPLGREPPPPLMDGGQAPPRHVSCGWEDFNRIPIPRLVLCPACSAWPKGRRAEGKPTPGRRRCLASSGSESAVGPDPTGTEPMVGGWVERALRIAQESLLSPGDPGKSG